MKTNYKKLSLSILAVGALALNPLCVEAKVLNWPDDSLRSDPDAVLRTTPTNGVANSLYIRTSDNDNTLNILEGSVIAGSVYGAYGTAANASTSGNTVNIYGGTIGGPGPVWALPIVAGANSDQADSTYNTVNVYGGTIVNSVYGANSRSGHADHNTVNIEGGSIGGDVVGGYVALATAGSSAKYNTVNITGGSIGGHIYGGNSYNGDDSHNTVNISGNVTLAANKGIYGGEGTASRTGNTLNMAWAGTVGTVSNFENINLTITDAVLDNSNTVLNISGTAANIRDTHIKIADITATKPWNEGESITLLSKTTGNGILYGGKFQQGLARVYEYDMGYAGVNNAVIATLNKAGLNQDVGDLTAGIGASSEFLKGSAELIDSASLIEEIDGQSRVIGAIKYSRSKIGNDSRFNINGTSMLLGVNRKFDGDKGYVMLGGFVEAGWGNYNTHTDFSGSNEINSSGKSNYYGVGLAARNVRDSGLYTRATIRLGHISTNYKSNNLADAGGNVASYDLGSMYYGASLGVGKLIKLSEKNELDIYGKYLYLHQNGSNTTIAGDNFDFKALNSHRLRTGLRLNHKNTAGLKTYFDLAYEYEFDGRSRAFVYGSEVPSIFIKGGTATAEIGFNYKPTKAKNLQMDLGLQGYIGKRQGVSANMQFKLTF